MTEPHPAEPGTALPGDVRDLTDRLRVEVGTFRAVERRRVFPPALQAGLPAGPRVRIELAGQPGILDDGLRSDLAVTLGERARGSWPGASVVWLTRPGSPHLHDEDQLWHAATRWAWACLGQPLRRFLVVTKTGWLDVQTGERRAWKRLRL